MLLSDHVWPVRFEVGPGEPEEPESCIMYAITHDNKRGWAVWPKSRTDHWSLMPPDTGGLFTHMWQEYSEQMLRNLYGDKVITKRLQELVAVLHEAAQEPED